MEHSMATIARTGSTPMTKSTIPAQGTDARMQGNMLANEVFVQMRADRGVWRTFALRIITGTTDMRAAFLAACKTMLRDMRKQNAEAIANLNKDGKPDPTKDDTKLAAKRSATASVMVSNLNIIANAWNGAATIEGLVEHANTTGRCKGATLEDIGFDVIVEYARLFSESKAGRKADPFITKLSKWLEKNPPAEDDKAGAVLWAELNEKVSTLLA
jgi:hypothetical protein